MFDFNILSIIAGLPGLLIAMVVHEYAHAQVADWMGDDTPRMTGRLKYIAGAAALTTARPFIWTRRRAVCFVPPVHRKQGRPAIWMPGHCLPCGISALWKTRKFLHLKFRSGALQSLPLQRSSMP